MRYIYITLMGMAALCQSAVAQEQWDLRKIVEYAVANNIGVQQAAIQANISQLNYQQNKLGQYPSAALNGSTSFNNGRNQDPTSFNLITQSYIGAGLQLQSSADIFNWFSKKNAVLASQWQYEAAKANTDKLKNDISLAVANNYLQVLLAREQQAIAEVQLKQTQAQLANTRKLVNAGALPELNAAELEAQEALDNANFITARGNATLAILQLKANMNLDADLAFDVVAPPVDLIPIENIADLQPDAVYALAIKNLPQQRVNAFNLKAAIKLADAAKGRLYPSIGAFGGLSSNFINTKSPIYAPTGSYSSSAFSPQVTIGGVAYKVNSPDYIVAGKKSTPFFSQLNNNFRQQVGLTLSVPILSGGQLRKNYERSKYDIKAAELQQVADNQKIKQDIYQAYNSATVALEKFTAAQKRVTASQRTLEFAQKRYDVGMLGTFELITQQNNLFAAKLQTVLNQYDYVFKMKVLEFYKGQGLKL